MENIKKAYEQEQVFKAKQKEIRKKEEDAMVAKAKVYEDRHKRVLAKHGIVEVKAVSGNASLNATLSQNATNATLS